MVRKKTPPWYGDSGGPMMVACQWNRSSPTGPALHWAGGSRPRSCSSLLILFRAIFWEEGLQWPDARIQNRAQKVKKLTDQGQTVSAMEKYRLPNCPLTKPWLIMKFSGIRSHFLKCSCFGARGSCDEGPLLVPCLRIERWNKELFSKEVLVRVRRLFPFFSLLEVA